MSKKVVCIDAGGNTYITVGKEYEIIGSTENKFRILNDNGDSFMYHKRLFKPIQPTSRNISLNLESDTSELQSKIEKALYHLKELENVLNEIGEGIHINVILTENIKTNFGKVKGLCRVVSNKN